jgi:hypothetical protein
MVFVLGGQWSLPGGGDRELHQWSLAQQIVGDGECLTGIVLLVAAVVAARGRKRAQTLKVTRIDVPERPAVPVQV